jgi:phosphatidylglycerol---prolipoprotein diacylglyceryl transferase
MHPVLLRVPLPAWSIPLSPALLVVAAIGAVVALVGWRGKAIDLLVIGVAVAMGGVAGALALRGDSYQLTELPLSSYGVTLCVALVVGWYLSLGLAKRDGLPIESTSNCFVIAAVAGFVAARLMYAAANADEFSTLRDVVDVRRGGLHAFGGMAGGTLGAAVFLRLRRLPLWPWADVAVPSLALGVAIGRVGSYLLGSAFGTPLGAAAPEWLRRLGTFPKWPEDLFEGAGSPAWVQHVTDGLLPMDSVASLPVHPTQLYEAIGATALLVALFALRHRQSFRGEVFLAFTFAYGLLRFSVDAVRGDPQRGLVGPHLAQHQIYPIAALMLAAAFVLGPARSIATPTVRRALQIASVAPAIALFAWLRPGAFTLDVPVQLSTSQWFGLVAAIAAAVAWSLLAKIAEAHPEAAMQLDLPTEGEPESASDDAEDSESAEPEAGEDEEPADEDDEDGEESDEDER